jgi:hypothetical protein
MKNSPNFGSIVDLNEFREAQPLRRQDGTLLPLYSTYDPPATYLVRPCQVITLPVKGSILRDKT